jgi:hypothetical protein
MVDLTAMRFVSIGACVDCARPANGHLFDALDDRIGAYCELCAAVRMAAARAAAPAPPTITGEPT